MILDLRMSGLSGMDVLEQMRVMERPVPVIVLSALGLARRVHQPHLSHAPR